MAQYNLGMKYDNGWGFARDWKQAVEWFRKAAEGGTADAQ
jgi:TPR repeat protein